MGNIYSDIKQYLGYEEPILSPVQLIETTNQINRQTLEKRLQLLEEQIDQDKDNIVTKDELKDYFEQLASKIDQNSDGIITHDELKSYVDEQLKTSKDEIEKWKSSYQTLHTK